MTPLVLVALGFALGVAWTVFVVGKKGFVGDDDTSYGRQNVESFVVGSEAWETKDDSA